MQYAETLPLHEREVVLTFDDGPLPHYSNAVLDILGAGMRQGDVLRGRPDGAGLSRKACAGCSDAGHTIGTHSQNHPLSFHRMSVEQAEQEIDDGIAATRRRSASRARGGAVLPDSRPAARRRGRGLSRHRRASRPGAPISPPTTGATSRPTRCSALAMSRLEAKGKGMLLLHDIQARTVAALPQILQRAEGPRLPHRPCGAGDAGPPEDPDRAAAMATCIRPWTPWWRRAGRRSRISCSPIPTSCLARRCRSLTSMTTRCRRGRQPARQNSRRRRPAAGAGAVAAPHPVPCAGRRDLACRSRHRTSSRSPTAPKRRSRPRRAPSGAASASPSVRRARRPAAVDRRQRLAATDRRQHADPGDGAGARPEHRPLIAAALSLRRSW